MNFSPEFLDDIRERLPVSEVVGRRVKLRRQGREFMGLSPFNSEKTPSFTVNDQKAFYHCFSSGKHGDIFSFLMETEGLSFPEAVERLAQQAGVAMPARDEKAVEESRQRTSLQDVMGLAAEYFQAQLQSAAGAHARRYLRDRDISPKVQQNFGIGYAPAGRNELKKFLADRKIELGLAESCGLLIHGDDIPVSYDRFRDRVVFPIFDLKGRVVGFGGRALSADVPAKYLNSPETPIFHKGRLLFNGQLAREAAFKGGRLIIVEGYMDVVALHRMGVSEAVAPMGTALTVEQLELAWRWVDEPILCFDGDNAGIKAATRSAELALPLLQPGKSIRFCLLPEGKDPDDMVSAGEQDALSAALATPRSLLEILWERESTAGNFDTPERRAALENKIVQLSREIKHDVVRRHYEQAFRERLRAFFAAPSANRMPNGGYKNTQWNPGYRGQQGGSGNRSGPGTRRPVMVSSALANSAMSKKYSSQIPLREAVLLLTMVYHPRLLENHVELFAQIDFDHKEAMRLQSFLLSTISNPHLLEAPTLQQACVNNGLGGLLAGLDQQAKALGLWQTTAEADDSDAFEGWNQALSLHHKAGALHKELKSAELALAQDSSEENLAHLIELRNQLSSTNGTEALTEGFGVPSGRVVKNL
jgi:DNA primase